MLTQIGDFSDAEIDSFFQNTSRHTLDKNEILSNKGDISRSIFFIIKGSFYQYYNNEDREEEITTDLFTESEWAFNLESLTTQQPAKATIKAFEKSEVTELTLKNLHKLIVISQKFLQFN